MSKVFEEIDDRMREWLAQQRMFFVATAPLAGDGLMNLSPKGLDSFAVLGPRRIAYLDLTGSGVETIAHLRENGRIVVMFCAFDGVRRGSSASTGAVSSTEQARPATTRSRRSSRSAPVRAR